MPLSTPIVIAHPPKLGYMKETLAAYEAVEQLITPTSQHPSSPPLHVDPEHLGALLRTINRTMRTDLKQARDLVGDHSGLMQLKKQDISI